MCVNLNYVKARLKLGLVALKPKLCRSNNPLLLCICHKFACLAKGAVLSELHLNKDYVTAFLRNYVDLTLPVPAVCIYYPVPMQAKIVFLRT